MNRDVHPLDQPNGTFRYVLNGAIETLDGDLGRISNELGHLDCTSLPDGKTIINYEALPGNKYVVFLKGEVDEIGLLDRCVYTTLFEDECLSFGENLYSTYRVRKGCETVVYFTDYVNYVRAITIESPPTNCDDLNLILGATRPNLDVTVRPQGGTIPAGSYIFAVRYLDENLNATEWLQFSQPVNTLVATSSYDDPVGLTGTSPVSFVINLTESSYPYFQVGVVPYLTESPSEVLVSPRQRGTSYTYTGNNTGFTTTTIDDLLVEAIKFRRAKFVTQLENKLILGGVAEKDEDWCKYQASVNKIQTNYWVKEVPFKDASSPGDPWNPDYGENLGYTADEVYAMGIVYVFEDGSTSPAFHIPGRAATGYDKQSLTVTLSLPSSTEVKTTEVEHLGLQIGQKVERWKVQNTSQGGGQMSYYESTQGTYPTTLDCDGAPVWGTLAGTPIRHHRFPSRKIEPHVGNGTRHLGIQFSNIEYPSDEIVGHFFVRGVRDDANKTILDKGVFFETWDAQGIVSLGEMKQNPKLHNNGNNVSLVGSTVAAISPRILEGEDLFGNYLSLDYALNYTGGAEGYQYEVLGGINDTVDIKAEVRKYDQGTTSVSFTNKNIQTQQLMPARFISQIGATTYRNASYTNRMQMFRGTHDFMSQVLLYGAIKKQGNPYDVLEVIEYVPIDSRIHTPGTVQLLGGDTFLTELAVGNIVDSEASLYIRGGFFGTQQPKQDIFSSYLSSVYVESTVNYLPIPGENNCERYYIPVASHLNPVFDIKILEYLLSLVSDLQTDLTRTFVFPCPLVYDLAPSVRDRFGLHLPLSSDYECCTKCAGRFDNRIHFSETSYQEESVDQYRVFLANNYRDLEGETGLITQLKRWEDRLIIFCEEGVWYLPPQVQERTNSEGIVSYVGTGQFFGIPPKRFVSSKIAGCNDPRTVIETPGGIFFYDSRSRIPYMVNRSLEPLNGGMRRWFLESNSGTLHAGFDEEFSRILLTSLGEDCGQSWTLSYSLLSKEWVSFHSYTPTMYMTGKRELIVVSDKFYTANGGDYNTPFILEAVQKATETRVWDALEFYTEVEEDGTELRWVTFDQVWAYNNYQSTGIIPIAPRQEGTDYMVRRVTSTTDADRDDRNWRINHLRSIVNSENKIFSQSCNLTQSDILPTTFGALSWYDQESLRSKYLVIRYIFSILGKKISYFYEKI